MKPIPSQSSREVQELLNKAQRLLAKAEKLEMVEHKGKKVPAFAADGKGAKDEKKKGEGHEGKIKECLKKKGGAASLEECAKECGVSLEECKKVIDKMDDVKISPHGDVVLMDGLQKADMATKDKYCMKNFGKKYSECSEKQKAQCDKAHGKMEKGEKCPECGSRMEKGSCVAAMSKMGGCGSMKMKKGFDEGAQPGFSTSFDSNPAGVMFVAESGGQTRNAYYTTNQYPYNGEDVANKGSTSESFNMESISGQMNPHDGGGVDRQVENGILSKAEEALAKAKDDLIKALCEQCGGNQFTGCRFGFGPECPGLEGTTDLGEGLGDFYHPSEYMRGRY